MLFWVGASYLLGIFTYISIDFTWTLAITIPVIIGVYVGAYFYDRRMTKKEAALAA